MWSSQVFSWSEWQLMAQHQIKWNFENQMMQSKTTLDLCLWCNIKVVIFASFQLIWVTTDGPTSNQVKFWKSNDAFKNYAWFMPKLQYKSCDLRKFSTDLSENWWPNIKLSEILKIKWCNQKLHLIYAYDKWNLKIKWCNQKLHLIYASDAI